MLKHPLDAHFRGRAPDRLCGLGPFKSTVPLVVAPTTAKDAKGHFVDGLDTGDLILYDRNVPHTAQLDFEVYPISLVVAVQTSSNSEAVLDELDRSGIPK